MCIVNCIQTSSQSCKLTAVFLIYTLNMNLDTLQINLILAVKENPDLWNAIDETQTQTEELWLELSKKFESSGIQISPYTLRYHWKALRDAYESHTKLKQKTSTDYRSFRFEKEMGFLRDHLLKPREQLQTKKRAILYDPEFLITEKDIEDTNDGEKITFIELPAKKVINGKLNFMNSKENSKSPNENKLQEQRKSLLSTATTKHPSVKYAGSIVKRQQQQQETQLSSSVKVSYLKEDTNLANNINKTINNENCKRASNDCTVVAVAGSNLAEKRRRLQRSATRDAAETMLRLESGVPSSSSDKSTEDVSDCKISKESASFVYIIDDDDELECKASVATDTHVKPAEVVVSMSEIVRNSLQQAADADEDLKFCEWIMSILKQMTNEKKNEAKKRITNSLCSG